MTKDQTTKIAEAAAVDPLWHGIRGEVAEAAASEPILASFLYASVLNETQLTQARHYSAAQMRACATREWDRKRSVAIIRDPWARAVSAYDHLVNVSYSA